MIELLQFEFAKNALIAGTIISILFGFLSFFIVMKKLSFLTVGISHAAFGGVALGILLGLNPYITAIFFCLLTGYLIAIHGEKSEYDSVIGILFAFTMALGVIFLSLKKDYTFDIMSYLFGTILGITKSDLFLLIGLMIGVFIIFYLFFKEIIFITFDKNVAMASGLPVNLFENLIIVILTLVIVLSIKLIGIILVSAFLIIPAAITILFFDNYKKIIFFSMLINLVIFYSGFFLSYKLNLPSGATVVSIGALLYFASALFAGKKN
ncbi:zinc transport system permease protein [Thermotomaculum hydrothermale]|uniref:Zinc transport system permease protein n=1 Tax=Thermotomaculum hydrothermale TaxID=981385 RepID=A0A7R6PXJ2_9BACT|nr:metal ABC transporter permease [Thermotomaculum hydrothermale]BBB32555.1 zinc transport system permease protein [Thermotomaculum hydrothermale]